MKFSRVYLAYSASVAVHLQPVVDLSDDHQLALGRRESSSRRAEIFKDFEISSILSFYGFGTSARGSDVQTWWDRSDMMCILKVT